MYWTGFQFCLVRLVSISIFPPKVKQKVVSLPGNTSCHCFSLFQVCHKETNGWFISFKKKNRSNLVVCCSFFYSVACFSIHSDLFFRTGTESGEYRLWPFFVLGCKLEKLRGFPEFSTLFSSWEIDDGEYSERGRRKDFSWNCPWNCTCLLLWRDDPRWPPTSFDAMDSCFGLQRDIRTYFTPSKFQLLELWYSGSYERGWNLPPFSLQRA